jgi:hypothetical protein
MTRFVNDQVCALKQNLVVSMNRTLDGLGAFYYPGAF